MASTLLVTAPGSRAAVVGSVQACYNCSHNFGAIGVVDGPTFLIANTSGFALTNVNFAADIGGATFDTFLVGTIPAGGSAILEPGVSADGGAHTGFFQVLGSARDTSDSGPSVGTTKFEINGLLNGASVDTGIFTPDATAGLSPDGTIASENFLGGGPSSDGPCNDCFGPKVIATLSTQDVVSTPEPASLAMFATATFAFGALRRRKKSLS